MIDKNKIYSVSELNFAAKQLIESGLPLLWVRGEVSNFVSAASGHWYFSIKDAQAQVRCVMFRHKSQYMDWLPKSGMQVEVLALPGLYEARGDFQLTLEQMRPAGTGALFEAFEKLKKKLENEGLFAEDRKRPLPLFPRQVGIITSPQAAALRDVLTTLKKRMPGLNVILYPTPVQGAGSAQKIAEAIALANQRNECDVIILCRGGGSIEDLWSFNEEQVARAIAASNIPMVSGVGHETDFTIADFVADYRAATPTAAAQVTVPDRIELRQRLVQYERRVVRSTLHQLERAMQQLDYLQRRLARPEQRLLQQAQHLSQLQQRLRTSLDYRLQGHSWQWQSMLQRLRLATPDLQSCLNQHADISSRLFDIMQLTIERYDSRLMALHQHLLHLDPQQVLARGYSMVKNKQGRVVIDSATLAVGEPLEISFARGSAGVMVIDT